MAVIDASPTAATGRSTLTCTPAISRTTAKCEAATSPTHTRAPCANTWKYTASLHLLRARATSPPPRLLCLRRRIWDETLCRGHRPPIWASGTCVTARAPVAHTPRRADRPARTLQRVHRIRTPENMHFTRVLVATFVSVPRAMWESEKRCSMAPMHWLADRYMSQPNHKTEVANLSPTWTEYELLSPPVSILL